ncbi:hypothetical protein U6G28_07520 [Actinomycetaceae bacterium MB13-C1-2]|nr:hypothetical protein U6G28_07520 [Actinomycetaceae bacterium MB13-C1-2]
MMSSFSDLESDSVPVSPDDSPLQVRVLHVEQANSVSSNSDGDLWPSAWADDGALYSACGDGTGFARHGWSDIVMNRIDGSPETDLSGERLSDGEDIAPTWDSVSFNRKPTGMLAADGDGNGKDELYLAVQDLRRPDVGNAFDEAPTATIVRSDDYGKTWSWAETPMFTDHRFTTIMFLDLGQSNRGNRWAYAYGLDGNWRTSHSRIQPDPTELFLAKVPIDSIQDRSKWQFYAGDSGDQPIWSSSIEDKMPVLTDQTRMYPEPLGFGGRGDHTRVAQGGVVWNPGLQRYIYSSWSEFTHEFYEAPRPWGPWNHIGSIDYGHIPWQGPKSPIAKHGGYAPTIPSKFISDDGTVMWMQSNWFAPASTRGGRAYSYGMRKVILKQDLGNDVGPSSFVPRNVALDADTYPLVARVREGQTVVLNDGRRDIGEDSAYGPNNGSHYWGYQWPTPRCFDRIIYCPGPQDSQGGWFRTGPQVEIRTDGQWRTIDDVSVSPSYPNDYTALEWDEYEFRFPRVCADAVRIIGEPGGDAQFTSVTELEVWLDHTGS